MAGSTSRRDSPSGFSSVPGHCTLLAGILFTDTHTQNKTQARAHTHTSGAVHKSGQRQTIVNGYNNVSLSFSQGDGGRGGGSAAVAHSALLATTKMKATVMMMMTRLSRGEASDAAYGAQEEKKRQGQSESPSPL